MKIPFYIFMTLGLLMLLNCSNKKSNNQEDYQQEEPVYEYVLPEPTIIDPNTYEVINEPSNSSYSQKNIYDEKIEVAYDMIGETVCRNMMEYLEPFLTVETIKGLSKDGLAKLEFIIAYCIFDADPEVQEIYGNKMKQTYEYIDKYRSSDYNASLSSLKKLRNGITDEYVKERLDQYISIASRRTSFTGKGQSSQKTNNSPIEAIDVAQIFQQFEANPFKANKEYIEGKTMTLKGYILKIERSDNSRFKYLLIPYGVDNISSIIKIYSNESKFEDISYPKELYFKARFEGYRLTDAYSDEHTMIFSNAELIK